jgi:hypothetical protein
MAKKWRSKSLLGEKNGEVNSFLVKKMAKSIALWRKHGEVTPSICPALSHTKKN